MEQPRQDHATATDGDVAIVGMACMFPDAPDLQTFWRNIVSGHDAIQDPPAGRWDAATFYDPSSSDDDRIYSQRGGYLPTEIAFDPQPYGIMPIAVSGGEVDQFLALKLVYDALADAGYQGSLPVGERTEFVLGRGNYLGPGNSNLFQRSIGIDQALRVLRAIHPEHGDEELEELRRDLRSSLPPFGPDLGPTHIPNIVTGRAANRLNLMGRNFTVDAACASSLIAMETAMEDLLSGKCDLAIAGGSHTFTNIPLLMVFCALNALSRNAQMRPFDEGADGTLPGEGIGVIVLKRRADAERDGDRIYALLKGVGSASDGRAVSVMAPRREGEVLALQRAYARAGIAPHTVGLLEAHGTATPVGDRTEIEAIKEVFGQCGEAGSGIAVGTVKSMIGHAMPASGIAGVIKAALALYHKVLPPTLHCENPAPELGLDGSAFYMNTATRPWLHPSAVPRRAGVNSFGFGGINAHAVLEEYIGPGAQEPGGMGAAQPADLLPWDSEVLLLGAAGRDALLSRIEHLRGYLAARPETALADLAFTLNRGFDKPAHRLSIVADSLADLDKKLARAHKLLADPACSQIKDPRGIYYFAHPLAAEGKIAFLFPGEGSQRVNMLSQLCLHFPEVRETFDAADRDIIAQGRTDLISSDVFPPPCRSREERARAERRLWRIDRQCEAIMPANRAMFTLFTALGIRADMMVGHSIGEWSSLTAGGIADPDPPVEVRISLDRMAKAIEQDPAIPRAALLAVATNRMVAESLLDGIEDAYIAVDNCPHQVVLAASEATVERVIARLRERGLGFERSRFDRGSHSPLFAGFSTVARRHFEAVEIAAPRVAVYSCCTAAPFPSDPAQIRELLVRAWEQPVEYRRTIEAMYEAGARIFIEAGPGNVLTAFTDDILRGKQALVLGVDLPKWSELTGLNHLVGVLVAQGLDLHTAYLYARRPSLRELTLDAERDAPVSTVPDEHQVMLNLSIPMMSVSAQAAARLRAGHGAAANIPAARPIQVPDPAPEAVPLSVPGTGLAHNGGGAVPVAAAVAVGLEAQADPSPPAPGAAAMEIRPIAVPAGRQVAPAGTPLAAPVGDGVMAHYLETMRGFLQAEQRLLTAVLRRPAAAPVPGRAAGRIPWGHPSNGYATPPTVPATPPAGPDAQDGPLPLLGEITGLDPGRSLIMRRRVDPAEDTYLHHHTFGGVMSTMDPTLEPLTVAPLTISLELMAEAAVELLPGLLLTGMADIRAHRWLQVDESAPTVLEIVARRLDAPSNQVRVQVREVDADGNVGPMVIEGTMILGTAYDPAPVAEPLVVTNPCRPFKTAREMYDEMWMFHGPIFQGVVGLDVSGEDGISGTLEVLPTQGMFRATDRPRLVTDVALLDAAGQVLGYWAKERLTSSFVVFPIRVTSISIFRPNLPVGVRVRCDVRIVEILPQTIKVDMDVVDPWGRVWMRITGWQDWRFQIVGDVYNYWRFPGRTIMSEPFPIPASPDSAAFVCYRMGKLQDLSHGMVTKCLAYMTLNHAERRTYHRLQGSPQRQLEWLGGRIAAKDAVRVYLRRYHGLDIYPGDIEIAVDEHGRPLVCGPWLDRVPSPPALSIAHTEGVAVALIGPAAGGAGIGIDLQPLTALPESFDQSAFAPDELALLRGAEGPARDERRLRFWCAKEAAAKALGRGLIDGPRSGAIVSWDETTGQIGVSVREALAAAFPHLAGRRLKVYTQRHDNYVVATCFAEIV